MSKLLTYFHTQTPHKDRLLLACLFAVLAFSILMDLIIIVELNLALLG